MSELKEFMGTDGSKVMLREVEDTSGFYNLNAATGELEYAPNRVDAPGGISLRRGGKETSGGGWAWFDSADTAKAALSKQNADIDKALEVHGLRLTARDAADQGRAL